MLIPDYDPETKTFTLQDTEASCMFVMTKEQVEALIAIYGRCIGLENFKNNGMQI